MGRLLDEVWSPGKTRHDLKLGIYSSAPKFLKKEGLKMELINLRDAASIKIRLYASLESFRIGKHIHTRRGTHPDSRGIEAPAVQTLPGLTLCFFI